MRTKSLNKLFDALQQAWANGEAPSMDADSRGYFYVDQPVSSGFSNSRGFVYNPSEARQLKARKHLIRAGLAGAVAICFAQMGHFIAQPTAQPAALATTAASTTSCSAVWLSLDPMKSEEGVAHGVTLHLERDIVIGGERLQTITAECPQGSQTAAVGFIKVAGTWKEKGAVPVEPHP